ncbi:hypothetical protein fsci_05410 [Francisella sciaenopsi]|uniref:GIY-YIG domain-containing protein n=2 Tax=Francisella sciaenopsi TaxID=3055034 RepID=A0ABQ6PDN4_9GAMM
MRVKEFSSEICRELGFYVYRLIDSRDGKTFYVGKGKGNRIFEHVRELVKNSPSENELSLKLERIIEIKSEGREVDYFIHRHGLSESEAFEVEAALIDVYMDLLTNKQNGRGSTIRGIATVEDICKRYSAESLDVKETKLLVITINRTILEKDIYDAVRFAWKVDVKRAKKAEYVLAAENGIVIGVFEPKEWLEANKENFPDINEDVLDRYGFKGEDVSKMFEKEYMYKRVEKKKGASNPIYYLNC